MTYIFKTFPELLVNLMDDATRKREMANRPTTKKTQKAELLNQAYAIEQICNMLKDTSVGGTHLMGLGVPESSEPIMQVTKPGTAEAAIRQKITEASNIALTALQCLDRCDRVDAGDFLLVSVSKAIEAKKAISTWIKTDPTWAVRMQEASKAFLGSKT